MHSANAAALFGGPKTLPDDGTYTPRTSENFSGSSGGNCETSCRSSKGFIQVDIAARCMCISGSSCFKVDVGMPGLKTSNGLGIMGRANGTKYSTKSYTNTKSFDYDAISMGIASNTEYGKWIHKARDCQGGGQQTWACIGVPCNKWDEVKSLGLSGKSIQVCNGVDYPTSKDYCPPGDKPCYVKVSPSTSARDRAGLHIPRKNNGDGSGESRGQTR
ncbi:hypothetical protein AZI86_02580 [Bdellovibrio bacteriovorus]|uniref:Uncharacterized protein n=2 Tax=Bdellovibrio bacteriovorus TaxID=959 RepID=A0A150WNA1_BDEBC|nr:hypothetical protein AZI86_02580 [Bdellovibrio bacteriovorus]